MLLLPDKAAVPMVGFTYGQTSHVNVSDGSTLLFDKVKHFCRLYMYYMYRRIDKPGPIARSVARPLGMQMYTPVNPNFTIYKRGV